MEGPQFSTRAESRLYQSWGCDVIGMTAMPEAKLAREAELPYALMAWSPIMIAGARARQPVEVEAVIAQLQANAATAGRMLVELAKALPEGREPSPIDTVLDMAIDHAARSARPLATMAKLDAVCRRCASGVDFGDPVGADAEPP